MSINHFPRNRAQKNFIKAFLFLFFSIFCRSWVFAGNTATFEPASSIPTGQVITTTLTVTVGSPAISTGGKIVLEIPDTMSQPSFSLMEDSPGAVYVDTSSTVGAVLVSTISGQNIIVSVTGGSLSGTLLIYFNAFTCHTEPSIHFDVSEQVDSVSSMAPISGSPFVRTLAQGSADRFEFENYQSLAQVGAINVVSIVGRNQCWVESPLAHSLGPITVSKVEDSWPYNLDSIAAISLSSTNFASTSSNTVTFSLSSGTSRTQLYFKLNSLDFETQSTLRLEYTWPGNVYPFNYFQTITNTLSGITNLSVDTGSPVSGQTSVTFSPDNDGSSDNVYINFRMPSETQYIVKISSDNFSSVVKTIYGYGRDARVSWDGYQDWRPNQDGGIAPPATYKIRVSHESGALANSSLTINLETLGIKGVVKSSLGTVLPGADINIWGPSQRFVRSQSDGTFVAYGLRAGSYNVRFMKQGYAELERNVTLMSGTVDLLVSTLTKASELRIETTRPVSAFLPEVFGHYHAHTSDWSKTAHANVRFAESSTTADAGDSWNTSVTTYSTLSLLPNVAYTVRLNIPNYVVDEFEVTLNPGETRTVVKQSSKQANMGGTVSLPSSANNPSGIWISVEAENQLFTQRRYYGGVFLNPGISSGTYSIFGIPDGTYTLRAFAPGFSRQSLTAVVGGGSDTTANFPQFSQGKVVVGTVTLDGNSNLIDNDNNGYVSVWVNVWSNANQNGSFTEVQVPTSNTLVSATFTLTGLESGVYEMFSYIDGFESIPPGRRTVTVGSLGGTVDVYFRQFTGSLSGSIQLPDGDIDYSTQNVSIEIESFNSGPGGSLPDVSISTDGHYSVLGLGSGFMKLTAIYNETGFKFIKSLPIVNGRSHVVDIDLRGDTFDISGTIRSNAQSPYDSLSAIGLLPGTTIYQYSGPPIYLPSNRVIAKRILSKHDRKNNSSSGAYDSENTFFGEYDTVTGTYTVGNVMPGTYRLYVNGQVDDTTISPEVTSETRLVSIISSDIEDQDFTLIDGFQISGTIETADGSSEDSRFLTLQLLNESQEVVQESVVEFKGSSIEFNNSNQKNFRAVAPGRYSIQLFDYGVPKKYSAKVVNVEVGVQNEEVQIVLNQAARIQGQLRVKSTGEILTDQNYSRVLADNFYIEARSNPWFPGGWGNAGYPIIDSSGMFDIPVNPGTYDIYLQNSSFGGVSDVSAGKKAFIPHRISGVYVESGQIKSLGVVDLEEGVSLSGTITDSSGNPLSNVLVEASPSGKNRYSENPIEAFTDHHGSYTLVGLDSAKQRFYDVIAAPRPDSEDPRYQYGFSGIRYGEVRKKQVDIQNTTNLNFKLQPALGAIKGSLVTSDSGQLLDPFDSNPIPGARVFVHQRGTIPSDNPIADIEERVSSTGAFVVSGLLPGVYDVTFMARGYSSAVEKEVVVETSLVDIGVVVASAGFKLSGQIVQSDDSPLPNQDEPTLVAVRNGFEEVLVGTFELDGGGNISRYQLAGFQENLSYSILLFGEGNDSIVLERSMTLSADTEYTLRVKEQEPITLSKVQKSSSAISIQFNFSKPLRNSSADLDDNGYADDSEGSKIISLKSGSGQLVIPDVWLSSDRLRSDISYVPAGSESTFTLTVKATFSVVNAQTGENYYRSDDFVYYVGIGRQQSVRIANAGAGEVGLEGDPSTFSTQAGTFGDDSDTKVEVVFRAADEATELVSSALPLSSGMRRSSVMAQAANLGFKSYPIEMAGAFAKAAATEIEPLGSFYDIFLPAGVSHFFPRGKEAQLCLKYDVDRATDPYSLNVYYFNPQTNEYLLEDNNKVVDTDNERICVDIGHASVFTVLSSSQSVLSGDAYNGELTVLNFPNPFNLNQKTVTLSNPGILSDQQTINGTMIKISVPAGLPENAKIEIFNVAGELVREINFTLDAGAHNYTEWDGKNGSGKSVASGTYIGRLTIGDSNEKFFKMAVLK